MTRPDVAVVIPVRGDAAPLARLLERLGGDPAERIVTVAREEPAVRAVCDSAAADMLVSAPGRGAQLHAGAVHARSEWLWFLHADALPEPGSVDAILTAGRHGAVAGCFAFRFQGPQRPARRALARAIDLRSRIGVPYGDQGLFFRRDVYLECGGFPDEPLFEEVRLVRRARRRGAFAHLDTPIHVSPRRWERDGWIRRTLSNRILAIGYAMGLSPRRLARIYEGKEEDRRRTRALGR